MSDVLENLKHKLVLFIGDLGAGKTTSIKSLLKLLKCYDVGSSPSYSIINEYASPNDTIYHIDLYRLESEQEAFSLGIEDYLYSGKYCFVEWPQIIFDYVDEPYHILKIEIDKNNSRKISLL
ncbi:MAG: tRNA (adenosine(37)-N6)-threonylcarbamoyltransferase complex ATPase subunit type 1 TsaE [Saprospiraceae bacterium]|nr:tRNA (adenosine(37)-N6)-threonylcarbamoyltransferase complex ATPase subunit type 1 TsaE [Bacteroidia bacterium]NNE14156.1 tRNA (adenosine(37)-N6)-threonylcarbamoyltransferase complex ATPase subunit type 1 TsaE [Saprospiraceae bacterium]NNL93529.1 tRNA (adenosine(37)-N6)-threonylcarbamoyltransferase complex ATPase subunit type 1 TsaE [Saprospiraceae bacterium]